MKVGIVGSRNYNDYTEFSEKIKEWEETNNIEIDTIISGGASGADNLAKKFAIMNNKKYIEFKADWSKYGKKAGPIRNSFIVEKSDEIIAFPSKNSIGTWDTVRKAQAADKKVTIFKIGE